MLGAFLALLAGTNWGLNTVLARVGLPSLGPMAGTLISLLSSLALAVVVTLAWQAQELMAVSKAALFWFALVGLMNYVLGRFFLYQGIERIGASRSSPIVGSSPLFAMVLAVIFLGESPTPAIIAGALTVVAGLYLITSEERP